MCKIFAITNVDRVNVNTKFLNTVKREVVKHGDKDGFGYCVLTEQNTLWGERTTTPHMFIPLTRDPKNSRLNLLPFVEKTYSQFGNVESGDPKSFIAHGRMSTNTVSVENTHPFVNDSCALIHNGVVDDIAGLAECKTNNDSEILLRYWEKNGIKDIEDNVSGYYAMAILDKLGKLHIVRDNKAMLFMTYSKTIDSYIIATKAEIIQGVCSKMKWKFETPEKILDNSYIIFDGNDIVSDTKISPLVTTYSSKFGKKANIALGYDAYDGENSDAWERYETAKEFKETDPEAEPTPSYKDMTDAEWTEMNTRLDAEEMDERPAYYDENVLDMGEYSDSALLAKAANDFIVRSRK